MPLSPGDPCGIRFTKYDGSRHWTYDGRLVGEDEHGRWLFTPGGAPMSRPGRSIAAFAPFVTCVSHDEGWVLCVNASDPGDVHRYVDISTVPVWEVRDGLPVATMVDLDLDVVERFGAHHERNPRVVDEDEFAVHRVRYGYAPDVVAAAEATCASVLSRVRANAGAFGPAGDRWLAAGTRAWLARR